MRKLVKLLLALLLVAWAGMCTLAKFDGGATRGMPSTSAAEAQRAGMLVKHLTVITDSGGPAGIHDAWIEISAATTYRFGFLPHRVPTRHFGPNDTTWLLSIAVPRGISLGEFRPGTSGKTRLNGATDVDAFDIAPPFPDTIHLKARTPGEAAYPVTFADGRSVWDAAPRP